MVVKCCEETGSTLRSSLLPPVYDRPEDDFPVSEITSESTPKDAQAEDTEVPKNGNTSTTDNNVKTQSWNRGPPVEDSFGDLFIIGRTFNSLLLFCESTLGTQLLYNGAVHVLSFRLLDFRVHVQLPFSNMYSVSLFLKKGRCIDIVWTYFVVAK